GPAADDPRADRNLDPGLLARRSGQPPDAEPLAQLLPVQLGPSARLYAADAGSVRLVQADDLPLADALGPVRRLLRARAQGQPDRDVERGLRPHGPGKGNLRAARAPPAQPAELDDHVRQPLRPRFRRSRRRRSAADGGRVRAAWRRPADLQLA